MSAAAALIILAAALITAVISGIFGMAGGLMLMGALTLVLPVQAAFVTHGFIQIVANGWRAILHRAHIRWVVVGFYFIGAAAAAGVVTLISLTPSKGFVYLMLFAVSMLVWLPKSLFALDAEKRPHALICGTAVTGLNLTAGVAGPLLDIFFVRTGLTRHQIVSTKAATQVLSHAAKIIVYGAPLIGNGGSGMPPWWLFAAAAPLSVIGTMLGARILHRMTDAGFIMASRWVITATGLVYLAQAVMIFAGRG